MSTAAFHAAATPDRLATGPLFVVGAPYSGATLLARSLALHPQIESLDGGVELEALLFALEAIAARRLPASGPLELATVAELASEHVRGQREPTAAVIAVLARLAAAAFRGDCCVTGAPELALHVDVLERLFPAARYVHVVRASEAAVRAATHAGSPHQPEHACRSWLAAARAGEAAERTVGSRLLRVRYEDLASSPDAGLARVLAFLGRAPAAACAVPWRTLCAEARSSSTDVSSAISDEAHQLSEALLGFSDDGEVGSRDVVGARHRATDPEDPQAAPIRRLVEAVVPAGHTVLVVSRGDDALVRLPGRYGWHFPRTSDGSYVGYHPADGDEAVMHLRAAERVGVRYLLIPSTSSWWLDHYHELREHLAARADLVAETSSCRLFYLRWAAPVTRTRESDARGGGLIREPNNRQAIEAPRPTPPRRDARRLDGELWAVTAYYNPARYANKLENYRAFRAGLAEAGVPLMTVEAAFCEEAFELTPADTDVLVQLRGPDVLWQKERLLNLGIQRLPETCDKVAWLDGDVLFQNPSWASDAARLLDEHRIVQLFSHCVRLPRGASSCEPAFLPFGPGDNELFHGVAFGVAARGRQTLDDFFQSGHTGFAWAARRSLLGEHGLYDANPLGNGDMDIAQAMWANRGYWAMKQRSPASRPHLERWANRFGAAVDGSVAYVDGLVLHLWHGDRSGRRYDDRLRVLSGFDPATDLEIDPDGGLYRWKHATDELRDFAHRYFALRQEEGA